MEFTIDRDELKAALDGPSKVAAKASVANLACVLLACEGGSLTVQGSDMTEWVMAEANCLPFEDGRALVSASVLNRIAKALPSGSACIKRDGDSVTVSREGCFYSVPSLDPMDFPTFPRTGEGASITLSKADLDAAMDTALPAVSREAERKPILTGLHLKAADGVLKVTSCDGYRGIVSECPADGAFDAVMPANVANRILGWDSPGDVTLTVTDTHFKAEADGFAVLSRLIEGEYPNVSKFFYDFEPECKARVAAEDMLAAVRRVTAVGVARDCVRLSACGEGIELSIRSADSSTSSTDVGSEVAGTALFGINAHYLSDALRLRGPCIEMRYEKQGKPIHFISEHDHAFVMPVRLTK